MVKKSFTQPDLADTVIAQDLRIKGDITSDNDIWVDGHIEGGVQTHGNLSIGANGSINGNINAYSVRVGGTITGDIKAEGSITCESSAQINGNLHSADLIVQSGAVIEGMVAVDAPTRNDEEE